jgi:hypothetical protein
MVYQQSWKYQDDPKEQERLRKIEKEERTPRSWIWIPLVFLFLLLGSCTYAVSNYEEEPHNYTVPGCVELSEVACNWAGQKYSKITGKSLSSNAYRG